MPPCGGADPSLASPATGKPSPARMGPSRLAGTSPCASTLRVARGAARIRSRRRPSEGVRCASPSSGCGTAGLEPHQRDRVSRHTMDVMPPFGGFCLDPDPRSRRTYYFFGAGSGITPLYAMIRSVLAAEPHSAALLAYGNSNPESIIFRDAPARLEEVSGRRLRVRHILSTPPRRSQIRHRRRGRMDAPAVAAFIDQYPPYAQDTRYYVCGPGGMSGAVRADLLGIDVPAECIHMESYGPPTPPDDSARGMASALTVQLGGEEPLVTATEGQTILNAVRAAGASPPYSCESAVCGACRAHLRDGSVHLRARMALADAEMARDVILTCHALPNHPPANRGVRLRRQRTWVRCNSMPEDDAADHVLHPSACVGEAKVSDAARRPYGKNSRVRHPSITALTEAEQRTISPPSPSPDPSCFPTHRPYPATPTAHSRLCRPSPVGCHGPPGIDGPSDGIVPVQVALLLLDPSRRTSGMKDWGQTVSTT